MAGANIDWPLNNVWQHYYWSHITGTFSFNRALSIYFGEPKLLLQIYFFTGSCLCMENCSTFSLYQREGGHGWKGYEKVWGRVEGLVLRWGQEWGWGVLKIELCFKMFFVSLLNCLSERKENCLKMVPLSNFLASERLTLDWTSLSTLFNFMKPMSLKLQLLTQIYICTLKCCRFRHHTLLVWLPTSHLDTSLYTEGHFLFSTCFSAHAVQCEVKQWLWSYKYELLPPFSTDL